MASSCVPGIEGVPKTETRAFAAVTKAARAQVT